MSHSAEMEARGDALLRLALEQDTSGGILRGAGRNSLLSELLLPDAASWPWFSACTAERVIITGGVGTRKMRFPSSGDAERV